VIQGDGINKNSIEAILAKLESMQLSADNIFFGMGGDLLQKMNRDTLKFAMKQSAMRVEGQWRDVYKDPVTDSGKRSKKGVLSVVKTNGSYKTIRQQELYDREDILQTVYDVGQLVVESSFADIRERALV
jgi:nicotinamide phosphoribosyltransferase